MERVYTYLYITILVDQGSQKPDPISKLPVGYNFVFVYICLHFLEITTITGCGISC